MKFEVLCWQRAIRFLRRCDFALNMMNFALNMMNFVLKIMNFVCEDGGGAGFGGAAGAAEEEA